MDDVRIEQWSLYRDPYQPPEAGSRLKGRMYGHPRCDDGLFSLSVTIVSADPSTRRVTTGSGRTYLLGEVAPAYAEFCAKHGLGDPFPTFKGREVTGG